MKHPFTSVRRLAGLSALVLAATLTACSDATGPDQADAGLRRSGYLTTSAATKKLIDINFNVLYPGLATQYPKVSIVADTTMESFIVDPRLGSIVILGKKTEHIIAMPANALCNPKTNSYGPSEWLKPCTLATTPIRFTVKTWMDASGRPHAEFLPAIRFTPDSTKNVRLYFQDPALKNYSVVFIPYCNAGNLCLNEATHDPTLETYVSPLTGGGYWVYRKLRHFSGYNVTAF
ncbi:MAG: hypothetical protein H7099_11075 [Gemmatimonadaceae bacterium]|nr:hypothetical protein [Gemmatimonadaceae bacterium]